MAETLAVLCPTVHRADKLAGLAENLKANTSVAYRLYFVIESWDEDSFEATGHIPDCVVVRGDFGSCAAAYNAGFVSSTEPYVFLANDDLEFPEGWEIPALAMIQGGTPIVGVNEGHGRMTCFSMVERQFIEDFSGVYDKPGTLVHPYKSQYVDTELAEYAKHRGVWGEAEQGGVIHRHWEWGEADRNHPNYQKAQATCDEDRRVFEARRREWAAAQS